MRLRETAAEAAELVASGQATVVRYAIIPDTGEPAYGVANSTGHDADPLAPVDWMCAGKPVVSYAALKAMMSAGKSCDDDIRPAISATPQCPAITLREVLTYRSGLVRGTRAGHIECVAQPPLRRPSHWNPASNAEYSNAGWEVLPGLVQNLTGYDFGPYVTGKIMASQFGATGAFLRPGTGRAYLDPAWIANKAIEKAYAPAEIATSMCGSLVTLCRFYQGILWELPQGASGQAAILISSNAGPDYFRRGISKRLTWALGFPRWFRDQVLQLIVPADGFGSIGSVLTLTPHGLRYAWVCASGAVPSLGLAFAVAMDGLRGAPDDRYLRMIKAFMRDTSR